MPSSLLRPLGLSSSIFTMLEVSLSLLGISSSPWLSSSSSFDPLYSLSNSTLVLLFVLFVGLLSWALSLVFPLLWWSFSSSLGEFSRLVSSSLSCWSSSLFGSWSSLFCSLKSLSNSAYWLPMPYLPLSSLSSLLLAYASAPMSFVFSVSLSSSFTSSPWLSFVFWWSLGSLFSSWEVAYVLVSLESSSSS